MSWIYLSERNQFLKQLNQFLKKNGANNQSAHKAAAIHNDGFAMTA